MSQAHSTRPRLNVEALRVEIASSGVDVVDDVSFTLSVGDVLGIVGESGSGKTTVALALLGHARRGLSIASGSVELDGVDVLALEGERLRKIRGAAISYVPQDPGAALNPALRVGVQIREVLTAHAVPEESARVLDLLDAVQLDRSGDIANRFPHQLSGGQQQRIAIAMAFACGPSVIVLDEPTTGLDVSTQRRILETVRALCDAHGVAGVYVSHDLSVVASLASTVAVMYAGRIVEIGRAADVLARPLHPYTRGLVAAIPSPREAHTLVGIEGRPPRPGRRPSGCHFAPRCVSARAICRENEPPAIPYENRLVKCVRVAELHRPPLAMRSPKPMSGGRGRPLLSVEKLSARYGSRSVLRDVTFDVQSHGCTAVVGESGSGKTTLARCLVGMHGNWSGAVRYEGAELARHARSRPRALLRQIQYVFQNPYASLNPRKTIEQIIRQPLEDHFVLTSREARTRVLKALDDVALDGNILRHYPDQLSGGERQRIAIARAIVVDPHVLVCDEVTSALDVSVQAVIIELLRRQQQERELALVFITHNLALVRSIAQQVVVVRGGMALEVAPVEQLFAAPEHAYTRALIRDIPRLEAAAEPLRCHTSS